MILMDNWGDKKYLGIQGIEVFDINGKKIKIDKITSEKSINK